MSLPELAMPPPTDFRCKLPPREGCPLEGASVYTLASEGDLMPCREAGGDGAKGGGEGPCAGGTGEVEGGGGGGAIEGDA